MSIGVDKIPKQSEFEEALEVITDLDKKIIKLGELNELAYEDFILSINTDSSVGKVVIELVQNAKSQEFSEGNSKLAWDRLVNKYAPQTVASLLKLKNEFHNSKFKSAEKNQMNGYCILKG